MIRVGIDVGGTNTDVAVIRGDTIISSSKQTTSDDITSGIKTALINALSNASVTAEQVSLVSLGTTHFLNAVAQSRGLQPVVTFRLGTEVTAMPPLSGWPENLRSVVGGNFECPPYIVVRGGYEFSGAEIYPLDTAQLRFGCQRAFDAGFRFAVISGIFSPLNSQQELEAAKIAQEIGLDVTIASDLGTMGLIERENSAILNAALRALAVKTIRGFKDAFSSLGLNCPMLLTQNDGTLIQCEDAVLFPVRTFASGPTNSMRGAAYLTKLQNAIVVDIGGTTTDAGMISNGLSVESAVDVTVAGCVPVNFRMPNVVSIALGGGTVVNPFTSPPTVGPLSVGCKLSTESIVFGGDTLTATDCAILEGRANATQMNCKLGPEAVAQWLSKNQQSNSPASVDNVMKVIEDMVDEVVDRVKTRADDMPVVVVGGGAMLLKRVSNVRGCSKLLIPDFHDVANAVGAAIAQVSATVDVIRGLEENQTPEQRLQSVVDEALRRAVEVYGAKASTVSVVSSEQFALGYIPGSFARVKVKVIGEVDLEALQTKHANMSIAEPQIVHASTKPGPTGATPNEQLLQSTADAMFSSISKYISPPNETDNSWVLTSDDIQRIAIGASILGSGGGGTPKPVVFMCEALLRSGCKLRVVPPTQPWVSDSDLILPVAYMGSPAVALEKLPSGLEIPAALVEVLKAVAERDGAVSLRALMSCEVGGMNSLIPLVCAGMLNIPVVDCDGMGRAFPELQMYKPFICGQNVSPSALADAKGNAAISKDSLTPKDLENHLRAHVVSMGCVGGIAFSPLTGAQVQSCCVHNTLSQAWRFGDCILRARAAKMDPIFEVVKVQGGKVLFQGSVCVVDRNTEGGFSLGRIEITSPDHKQRCLIKFQNENLACWVYDQNADPSTVSPVTTVPDIISVLETSTARPFQTEELMYGLRVTVIGIPCSPDMANEQALPVVGPAAFGLKDVEYSRLAGFLPPPTNSGTRPQPWAC